MKSNHQNFFFDKIKEDEDRDDYCWLVQFEGIFEAELHPAIQQNKPKTPKIRSRDSRKMFGRGCKDVRRLL